MPDTSIRASGPIISDQRVRERVQPAGAAQLSVTLGWVLNSWPKAIRPCPHRKSEWHPDVGASSKAR